MFFSYIINYYSCLPRNVAPLLYVEFEAYKIVASSMKISENSYTQAHDYVVHEDVFFFVVSLHRHDP